MTAGEGSTLRALEPSGSVAERLRIQAGYCLQLGSPLYAELLERAAADFEAGGVVAAVLEGRGDDPADSMLALRLMGAVNRLVLRGDEQALGELYAAPERDPEAEWDEFRAVLERHREELLDLVELPVQTNEVGRCAALLPGFLAVAAEAGLPLRLLEVGASAGLNLRWDSYRYEAPGLAGGSVESTATHCEREASEGTPPGFAWGPADSPVRLEFELLGVRRPDAAARVEVAERRGCDAAPVDPTPEEGRQTLLAYVWPDQRDRLERLRAALELAARIPAEVERASAPAWLARQLAEPARGRATVVYHSIVFQYLDEGEREAFLTHLRDAAARATPEAPLAWLRMEPAGELADVRLTIWPGGGERLLARAGYHGSPIELLP